MLIGLKRLTTLTIDEGKMVRGKTEMRPYQVDIRAWRKGGLFRDSRDIWVECKAHKVKRTHIQKLVMSAIDVRDASNDDISEWAPDILMVASNVGFGCCL